MAALLTLLAALATPAVASASPSMQVGVADDSKLFTPLASTLVDQWQAAGVDVVRVVVPWGGVAPDPRSTTPPRAFRADDPGASGYRWDFVDRAIALVRSHGMKVDLVIWGPAPWWASQDPRKHDGRWKPSAAQFGAFTTAVVRRYHGQIDAYILWNEPNQSSWLRPNVQAPDVYRDMVNAAVPAMHRVDPRARVVIGALASTGHTIRGESASTPLAFLRRLACVDNRYRVVRKGACRHFRAPQADGFGLHPHGLKQSPYTHSRNRDEATISDLKRFEGVLDRLTRMHRLRAPGRRFPIWLDEFGYQTNPPDRYLGVSWSTQADWLKKATQIAWSDPRVKNLSWWVWRDESLGKFGGNWQSGLYTHAGRPKPSHAAFLFPFMSWRSGGRETVWGQARPGGRHTITIQWRGRRGGWHTLARFRSDPWGGFLRKVRRPRGVRQYRALSSGGPTSPAYRA